MKKWLLLAVLCCFTPLLTEAVIVYIPIRMQNAFTATTMLLTTLGFLIALFGCLKEGTK